MAGRTTASGAHAGDLWAPGAAVHGGGETTGTTGERPGDRGGLGRLPGNGPDRICDRLKRLRRSKLAGSG